MKSLMIILISMLSLANFTPPLQAQSITPLTFIVDETNIDLTVQAINDTIKQRGLVIYPEFEDDLESFIIAIANHVPICTSATLSPCPPNPTPILNSFSSGIYDLELRGFTISTSPNPTDNILSGHFRYDTPPTVGSPNFSILTSHVAKNRFFLAHAFLANTIIFFSIIQPNGRGEIRAIIIADKYIL